jgi:hypothetical protein
MIEHVELIHLLENPAARRLWLLEQALRSVPLEAAVGLARTAEAFVMGSAVETVTDDPATVLGREPSEPSGQPDLTARPADREAVRTGFGLAEDQRDRLLERLAEGAEFGACRRIRYIREAGSGVPYGLRPGDCQATHKARRQIP